MTKHLDEIPDNVLAKMVRDGCYSRNVTFGRGRNDSRYLLVLAVPYGRRDDVSSLPEAYGAFRDLLDTSDWFERQIQVLTVTKSGKVETSEQSYEQIVDVDTDGM